MKHRKLTHPGIVFNEDVLKPLGIAIAEASKALGVNDKTLTELLNENSSLSPDMAVRIGKATNTTSESWMNMQTKLDLWYVDQQNITIFALTTSN